jgi:RNA polymerase sigma-54 factor
MSLSPKLMMRQAQSLVMTPQLMQAIKLLQLSSLDLDTYVAQEIERNPLLERAEEPVTAADGNNAAAEQNAQAVEPSAADWMDAPLPESRAALEERLDTDLGNMFPDEAAMPSGESYTASPWTGTGLRGEDDESSFDAILTSDLSLGDHLERQLAMASGDPVVRMIGRGIVDSVDEAGYFHESAEELAERLGVQPEDVEHVLALIQTFEPPGIAARCLRECLAIQLRELDRCDPAMERLRRGCGGPLGHGGRTAPSEPEARSSLRLLAGPDADPRRYSAYGSGRLVADRTQR